MDKTSSLKSERLEELASEESFLRELASFFAHKQMRSLNEIPRVISIYSFRNNYESKLKKFNDYLNAGLSEEFKNGEANIRPRVVISRNDEPNTYSIQVDFFLERRKMPGLPLSLNLNRIATPVYYTISPVNLPRDS